MAGLHLRVLLLASLIAASKCQKYTFDNDPLPEAKSLLTMYAFFVYSFQDAPERNLGQPFVKFVGLRAVPDVKADMVTYELPDYKGVQVSIVPYRDFWKLVDPSRFCSTDVDVAAGKAKEEDMLMLQNPEGLSDEDANWFSHSVQFGSGAELPADQQATIHSTAVYILMLSNCGNYSGGKISGSIIVKNAYGFLPGNEFYKMPFYGWLVTFYAVLAIVWFGLLLRKWKELFHIQYCIAAVVFFGLAECFLWWRYFNDWNDSGVRGTSGFVFALLFTVAKTVFSYMLILVASLGWGITRPFLDKTTQMQVQGISVVYIVLDFIREAVLSFRHSHSLSITFVLLCLLPVAMLNGGIFYWIFSALSQLIENLKERKQLEKLKMFERLWAILTMTLAAASLTVIVQIFDLSRSISTRWHYQWFFADGVSHILFLIVLVAMMFLWAPRENSSRYAYSSQIDGNEQAEGAAADSHAVWADEEAVEEDAEDDSFWATTHGGGNKGTKKSVGADTIGVEMQEVTPDMS